MNTPIISLIWDKQENTWIYESIFTHQFYNRLRELHEDPERYTLVEVIQGEWIHTSYKTWCKKRSLNYPLVPIPNTETIHYDTYTIKVYTATDVVCLVEQDGNGTES